MKIPFEWSNWKHAHSAENEDRSKEVTKNHLIF